MLRPHASWKMNWKVVERRLGDSVSSLLGNQRCSFPRCVPSRGMREKGKKPPIVSVSRTTMEGFAFKVVNLEALIKSYRHRWLKLFIFNQCNCKATFKKPF